MSKKVIILDYGMGNLFNIQRVLNYIGVESEITIDANKILTAERLIIPGVGAFDQAMNNLKGQNLIEPIQEYSKIGRPILGICLGMQLLFSESSEFGLHSGLDLIKGSVLKFEYDKDNTIKIPQIGWNTISKRNDKKHQLLSGIDDGTYYYFIHSYFCKPDNDEDIMATTIYGDTTFCSATHKNNIWGCQFHPERSGEAGVKILKNFINL